MTASRLAALLDQTEAPGSPRVTCGPRILTLKQQRDMARLLVDMADRLIDIRSFYGHLFSTDELADDGELLSRFAALDEKAGAA